MKRKYFLIFIFFIPLNLFAQTTEPYKFKYGLSCEFFLQSDSELVYSPVVQFYSGNCIIFFGPEFTIGFDGYDRDNEFGFRLGVNCIMNNWRTSKHETFVQVEIEHAHYEFVNYAYDNAVPGIPIKATLKYEKYFTNLPITMGVKYHFFKGTFVAAMAGPEVKWYKIINPINTLISHNGYLADQYDTKASIKFKVALEIGINF